MRIDFHSHLLPAVDDGSQSVEQSIDALRAFAAQGVDVVVTTPHFDASLTRSPVALASRLAEFDAAWDALQSVIALTPGLPTLKRGTEVMLDEPDADLSDPRIRLDGSVFVLCEFPSLRLPTNAEWGIANLISRGWQPVVAHPERYRNQESGLASLRRLREAGALFQANAGSLLGQHGELAERVAWRLLALGWVDYLSSDYHARGAPATARAVELLTESGAGDHAIRLTHENPARLLAGERPLPTEPFARTTATAPWWQRLISRRGGKGT